ncbi:TlyA family RNA methyltransferase [Leptospira idonii]|uniref:TlyA family RNA methyltransferase n=1 Tax=Leptospira idonii TaxID=1193500 RepID=A0A4R9M325_9LEPT|nr:TlyA family RNA methyltransferase [Leptospira idonii]TGN20391.1 TlyA family RNA methyltransferase [Leptospira idonii]
MPKEKIRLDAYLIKHELCDGEKHALSLILSGSVLINDTPIFKPGTLVKPNDKIRLREVIKQYVSRGAWKLLGAFSSFPDLSVKDKLCFDFGASTGGFTQVLLEKGASRIFAIDVGYGLLSQRIANDPKVTVLDRTHIKDLNWDLLPRESSVFICMDLSFISLSSVFPTITRLANESCETAWEGVSLVKPQFELDSNFLVKGIVTDPKLLGRSIISVWRKIRKQDPTFRCLGLAESPIQGADGNREFLLRWKKEKIK